MEDDLVYARFLALARGGTYRQINRDTRGSLEVDRGCWEQDVSGALRLRSSCRALRARALFCGALSVATASQDQLDGLPPLLASLRGLLGEYTDSVFDAATVAEINVSAAAPIFVAQGAATFDRADADGLARQIGELLVRERTGIERLDAVGTGPVPLFVLPGSVFREWDPVAVRRIYRVDARTPPPFYFARIDAGSYARQVGPVAADALARKHGMNATALDAPSGPASVAGTWFSASPRLVAAGCGV